MAPMARQRRNDSLDLAWQAPGLPTGEPLPIPGVPQRDSAAGVRPAIVAGPYPTKGSLVLPRGEAEGEGLHASVPAATEGPCPAKSNTSLATLTKVQVEKRLNEKKQFRNFQLGTRTEPIKTTEALNYFGLKLSGHFL